MNKKNEKFGNQLATLIFISTHFSNSISPNQASLDTKGEENSNQEPECIVREYLKKKFNYKVQPGLLDVKEESVYAKDKENSKDLVSVMAMSPVIDLEMPNVSSGEMEAYLSSHSANSNLLTVHKPGGRKPGSYLKISDILAKENSLHLSSQGESVITASPNNVEHSSVNVPSFMDPSSGHLTLQAFANQVKVRQCKFCESLLVEQANKDENGSSRAHLIEFCSEFCKVSYQKLVIIRKYNIKSFQSNPKYSFLLAPSLVNNSSVTNENQDVTKQSLDDSGNSGADKARPKKRSLDGSKPNEEKQQHVLKWNPNLTNINAINSLVI
jgi:hypothetical protein